MVRRILLIVLLLLIVAAGVIAVILVNWTRGPLPNHGGEITVEGLTAPVEIIRDDWGVPHIYASNSHDLFFAQGYTHAQDRWWQMEFSRHTGNGTLSEIAGNATFSNDLFIRTIGWRRAAEKDWEVISDESKAVLEAFSDGVNAYLATRTAGQLAFEYNMLGVTGTNIPIVDWTPIDTLVWTKVMSWGLGGNLDEERLYADLVDVYGQEMADDFMPAWPYGEKPTILTPEDLGLASNSNSQTVAQVQDVTSVRNVIPANEGVLVRGNDMGSNNWVVSGERSETGMPLLANDPHLSIQMPSIWYEVGLHCQPVGADCPYEVVGFTFPASPGVVIGHNQQIAWGVTNVGPDTQDLYLLEINPDDDTQYRWNSEWRDLTIYTEIINVDGRSEPVEIQVRESHLGPIISDNRLDDDDNLVGFQNDTVTALRWTALDASHLVDSILLLNVAEDWEDFRDALRLWDSPAQNFVYVDVEGNIGYQTPGSMPVRAEGHSGIVPVDGTTDEFEWLGLIPFDELPSVFNPERGWIATANQALVPLEYYEDLADNIGDDFDPDANYAFDYFWSYGYRGERIHEMLEATDQHSIESFQVIQGDNQMTSAMEVLPYLLDVQIEDEALNDALEMLADWDFQMHMDSPEAALYAQFWLHLVDMLYEDQLGDIGDASGRDRQMWATLQLLDDPDNEWWDDATTDEPENRDVILIRAFRAGYDSTVELLGENPDEWSWGALHGSTFISNPLGLSGIGPVEDMVNRGPFPTSGGAGIVNATGWNTANGDYATTSVPSLRMIIDTSDFSNSVVMHTTGQSGHPFSGHYDNMIDPWRNIEYHAMLWTREDVEAAMVSKLILLP